MTTVSVLTSPRSFQQLIDRARFALKDDAKFRYADAELLVYSNLALGIIKRRRPDLFYGTYGTPLVSYELVDNYPLPPEYESPLVNYLIARSEAKTGEFADESRAAFFFGLFDSGLTN